MLAYNRRDGGASRKSGLFGVRGRAPALSLERESNAGLDARSACRATSLMLSGRACTAPPAHLGERLGRGRSLGQSGSALPHSKEAGVWSLVDMNTRVLKISACNPE